MNTQTHLLAAAALLARPGQPRRNAAILVGAFLPDLSIYALFVWSRLAAIPQREVWDAIYWSDHWQTASAVCNSAPLWLAVLAVGLVLHRGSAARPGPGLVLAVLAGAALLHLALDAPVHVEDAHRHLWPLSDYRFRSVVSYWNPEHFGRWMSAAEAVLGLALCAVLWARFKAWWVRGLLAVCVVAYVAVPAYWVFLSGMHG